MNVQSFITKEDVHYHYKIFVGSFTYTLKLFLLCDFWNIFWKSVLIYHYLLWRNNLYIYGLCLWTKFFFFYHWELLDYNIHLKWCKETGLKINRLGHVLLFDNSDETNMGLYKRLLIMFCIRPMIARELSHTKILTKPQK